MWAVERMFLALALAGGAAVAEEPGAPEPAPEPALLEFIGSWPEARGGAWLQTLEINAWLVGRAHEEDRVDLRESEHD